MVYSPNHFFNLLGSVSAYHKVCWDLREILQMFFPLEPIDTSKQIKFALKQGIAISEIYRRRLDHTEIFRYAEIESLRDRAFELHSMFLEEIVEELRRAYSGKKTRPNLVNRLYNARIHIERFLGLLLHDCEEMFWSLYKPKEKLESSCQVCTVVAVDLQAYLRQARALERASSADSVLCFNEELQSHFRDALDGLIPPRDIRWISTGDGVICFLPAPIHAVKFAIEVHSNQFKKLLMRKQKFSTKFRIGMATGPVAIRPLGHLPDSANAFGGTVIGHAVRLESRCVPGGVLMCPETAKRLYPDSKSVEQLKSGLKKTCVKGKPHEKNLKAFKFTDLATLSSVSPN